MPPLAFALVASLTLAAAPGESPAAPAAPIHTAPKLVAPERAKANAASRPAAPNRTEAKPRPAAPSKPAAAPATVASAERITAAEDAEHEAGLQLVEQKCAKCHALSLAIGTELSLPEWKLHMKRMASRPGAAISEEQARRIHEFLKAHAARGAPSP